MFDQPWAIEQARPLRKDDESRFWFLDFHWPRGFTPHGRGDLVPGRLLLGHLVRGRPCLYRGEGDSRSCSQLMYWALDDGDGFSRRRGQYRVTEITEIKNRGHALTIANGWREVADTALAFIKRFVTQSRHRPAIAGADVVNGGGVGTAPR